MKGSADGWGFGARESPTAYNHTNPINPWIKITYLCSAQVKTVHRCLGF